MFTLNDLLDQVECQGDVVVRMNRKNGDNIEAYHGNNLRQVPCTIGCKELTYIYSDYDMFNERVYTVYEVNE